MDADAKIEWADATVSYATKDWMLVPFRLQSYSLTLVMEAEASILQPFSVDKPFNSGFSAQICKAKLSGIRWGLFTTW
jgi:hypothetical protein